MSDSVTVADHLTIEQLDAGLDHIQRSPTGSGPVLMIVRRPGENEREVVAEAELDVDVGVVGDNWKTRGSTSTPDGSANPVAQITIMNSRVLALLARSEERWKLSGDQLIIDMDMSIEGLPPGSRLGVGSAVIEVSEKPHTGCAKFAGRFGADALRFVSTPTGRSLRLRGVNTRIVQSGTVRVGDVAERLSE